VSDFAPILEVDIALQKIIHALDETKILEMDKLPTGCSICSEVNCKRRCYIIEFQSTIFVPYCENDIL
jgi:hypothetical protein